MDYCWQRERWRPALSAILDGEDPPVPREQVDRHLEQCEDCAQWLRLAGKQRSLLRTLPGPHRDLTQQLIGVTEAHICACHQGGRCECTNCVCPTCTCHGPQVPQAC